MLAAPMRAQTTPRVTGVAVHGAQTLEVEIRVSSAITPVSQTVPNPERIVIDFPGALPAAELHALKVNRGPLKGIRTGLFSSNPPITRVVLDVLEPQSYEVFTTRNLIMLKLGPSNPSRAGSASLVPAVMQANPAAVVSVVERTPIQRPTAASDEASSPAYKLAERHLAATAVESQPVAAVAVPSEPGLDVSFRDGALRIHAAKATLAQVLFEVQRQTGAEIAIPAGAESEQVVADFGPGPARDVLAALLNGSPYNFIFVGNDGSATLEKVILSRRDNSIF